METCKSGHARTPENTITNKKTGKRQCRICRDAAMRNRVPPPCSLDECDEPMLAKTYCKKHYRNWTTYGDPLGPPAQNRYRPGERWLPVPGWEGLYEVSDHGRVWSVRKRRLLTSHINRFGYPSVALCRNRTSASGKQVTLPIHRIEAAAFLGPRPKKQGVRHLDGDHTNNLLSNLAYGTQKQNMHDAIEHGTHRNVRVATEMANRETCRNGHPYMPGSFYFNKAGAKICRACDIDKQRRHRERKTREAARGRGTADLL